MESQQAHSTDFASDPIMYYGYVKLLEIIGEAAYMLTLEFKDNHPQTPWKKIVGMRHVIHPRLRIASELLSPRHFSEWIAPK